MNFNIQTSESHPVCRHCGTGMPTVFADLGATPISNDYLTADRRQAAEPYYPLRARVCENCRLVQIEDYRRADDLFRDDYAYFSSVSSGWLAHSKRYANRMSERFGLDESSLVVEVASNDGYLLQYFKEKGISVLGIEPCRSVAEHAVKLRGIPTRIEFFGVEVALRLKAEGISASLTAANNVLAHVPDINDFVSGFREVLAPQGVSTFEFPHLLNLIRDSQFDTIYHEHFSYISLIAADRIFTSQGMRVFDVESIPTHGGSLRLFVGRSQDTWSCTPAVEAMIQVEREAGLADNAIYLSFAEKVKEAKRALLELLVDLKRKGKSIVGYGAPAKGNTLLNYCGIGADFLEFTVDRSLEKQGKFLPGTRLAIRSPEAIAETKPDYVLILPWNIKDEIMEQQSYIRSWGGKFIVPIPRAIVV